MVCRGTGAGPAVARHDRLDGRKTAPGGCKKLQGAGACFLGNTSLALWGLSWGQVVCKLGRENAGAARESHNLRPKKKSQRARPGLPFPRFPRPAKTPALLLALGLELGALGLFQPGQALT